MSGLCVDALSGLGSRRRFGLVAKFAAIPAGLLSPAITPGLEAAGELSHAPAAATACMAVLLATSCTLPSTTPACQATGIARLDSLLQNVLLGGSGRWPGLLFRCAGACITCLHCLRACWL